MLEESCCSYFLHYSHIVSPWVSSVRCYLCLQRKPFSGPFVVYLAVYSCRTESYWEQKVAWHTRRLGFVFFSSSISTSLCFYPKALSFRPLETENTSLLHKLWWVCLALLSIGFPYPAFPLFSFGWYFIVAPPVATFCDVIFFIKNVFQSQEKESRIGGYAWVVDSH